MTSSGFAQVIATYDAVAADYAARFPSTDPKTRSTWLCSTIS